MKEIKVHGLEINLFIQEPHLDFIWHDFTAANRAIIFYLRTLQVLFTANSTSPLTNQPTLLESVVEGLQEVKGHRITILDLREIPHAIAGWFVVAHGTSRTQVEALAQSVEAMTRKQRDERPWGKQGLRNGEWAILDYSDVVVHVFHEEARARYALEELWGDADIRTIEGA